MAMNLENVDWIHPFQANNCESGNEASGSINGVGFLG
jgi:hypothetical protein